MNTIGRRDLPRGDPLGQEVELVGVRGALAQLLFDRHVEACGLHDGLLTVKVGPDAIRRRNVASR